MTSAYCVHGYRLGFCDCWQARKIETLQDAQTILFSGKASYFEWRDCAAIFTGLGLHEQAAECTIHAIESLGGKSHHETKIRFSLSTYFHLILKKLRSGRASKRELAELLALSQDVLEADKHKFDSSSAFVEEASSELVEAIDLASEGSKVSLTKLAAKFRLARPRDKTVRWGMPDLALETINKVLSLNPDDSYALVSRASIYADLKKYESAQLDAERALQLRPDDVVTLVTLGNILLLRNRGMEAWPYLSKAMELQPTLQIKAMLFIACAVAMQLQVANEDQARLVKAWRAWAFKLRVTAEGEEMLNEQRATLTAAIRVLINNGELEQAVLALGEFQSEHWGGFTQGLYEEILEAAMLLGVTNLPTLSDAVKGAHDYYPDLGDIR